VTAASSPALPFDLSAAVTGQPTRCYGTG
jgi:hypothetical protein